MAYLTIEGRKITKLEVDDNLIDYIHKHID